MGIFSRTKPLPSVASLPPLPKHHANHIDVDLDELATSPFYCVDGGVYHTLREFSDSLLRMSEDTFKHHVNTEKNDFSNWIDGCFTKDKEAAGALRDKGREEMLRYFLALASRPEPLPTSPIEQELEHRADETIRLLDELHGLDRIEAREQFIKIRNKLWQEFTPEERTKVLPKLKELYEALRS